MTAVAHLGLCAVFALRDVQICCHRNRPRLTSIRGRVIPRRMQLSNPQRRHFHSIQWMCSPVSQTWTVQKTIQQSQILALCAQPSTDAFLTVFSGCGTLPSGISKRSLGLLLFPPPSPPSIRSENLAMALLPLQSITSRPFHISMFDCFLCKTGH